MDDTEYKEMVAMRRKNMNHQIFLLEKYFPWTCGPYEDQEDEIEPITCCPSPFGPDDKIFHINDEDGNPIGEPYSYNDWLRKIDSISGVNPELLGPADGEF